MENSLALFRGTKICIINLLTSYISFILIVTGKHILCTFYRFPNHDSELLCIYKVNFSCVITHTDLPELSQQLSIAVEYNSKRQNKTGDEESDDVAVIYDVSCIPVQK